MCYCTVELTANHLYCPYGYDCMVELTANHFYCVCVWLTPVHLRGAALDQGERAANLHDSLYDRELCAAAPALPASKGPRQAPPPLSSTNHT